MDTDKGDRMSEQAEIEAAFEGGVCQAIAWLRADYEYGTGPEWREDGAEWIEGRLAEWRRTSNDLPTHHPARTHPTEEPSA